MYISRRALRQQFDPRTYPREAYLLCKLQWGARGRNWIHWARNDEINDYHVERYFLEQIFEPRNYSFCDMTWYLSWSPCAGCCDIIQDFLEEQHNVHLDIHVARIYYAHVPRNRAGLRHLIMNGVAVHIMNLEGNPTALCLRSMLFVIRVAQATTMINFSPWKFIFRHIATL
uniref:CMP/dCMP-type deaminase domain-containing protein n=1 Tax=Catharus ustulatus TaxID=91951 RepID=A0A8C3XXR9_CATUS